MKTIQIIKNQNRKAIIEYSMTKKLYYVICNNSDSVEFESLDSAVDYANSYVESDDSSVIDSGSITVFPKKG